MGDTKALQSSGIRPDQPGQHLGAEGPRQGDAIGELLGHDLVASTMADAEEEVHGAFQRGGQDERPAGEIRGLTQEIEQVHPASRHARGDQVSIDRYHRRDQNSPARLGRQPLSAITRLSCRRASASVMVLAEKSRRTWAVLLNCARDTEPRRPA